MHIYQLARAYTRLRDAHRRDDSGVFDRELDAALGMGLGSRTLPWRPDDHSVRWLTYRGFKPAELAMLAADIKPIVKMEDIPIQQARQFVERFGDRYAMTISEPYRKDYLLLRSRPTRADDRAALVSIYTSRDGRGAELHDLERRNPDDVRTAGAMLGFPPCCVEAFATDHDRSRADQDTLNDDATRRVLQSAPTNAHPALDPLSDRELLGFYPCRRDCPAAIQRALTTLGALGKTSIRDAKACVDELGTPILFWRLPFMVRLTGHHDGDLLRYTDARINVFPATEVRAIQVRFGRRVLATLARGDACRVVRGALEVFAQGDRIETLGATDGVGPVLATTVPWQPQVF